MRQEDQKYGNNNSGGRVVKKQKQKKIPQRGLGVAQLEKIRLEELQKNEGGGGAAASFPFAPNLHQPPSHEFRSSSYRTGSSSGYGLVSIDNNLGGSCSENKFSFGLAYQNQLPVGSSSMQQQQHQKMNVARSISSGQTEPPSNQSYNNSNYNYRHPSSSSSSFEHDKLGMKRTYPFSLDQPRSPPVQFKIPPNVNASTFNSDPGTSNLREGPFGFTWPHQFDRRAGTPMRHGHKDQLDWKPGLSELNLRNGKKENEPLDTALTLGLPTPNKAKLPFVIPALQYQDVSSQQEIYFGDPLFRRDEPTQSQRVYDFFPPQLPHKGHLATSSSGGKTEPLDLDLKL